MHITYDANVDRASLSQGDVLKRTPALDSLLAEVYPHFHQHPKNLYFMVLTQSCDLVVRSGTTSCKAQYISIAPVRKLDLVLERFLSQQSSVAVKAALPVLGNKTKSKAAEFLTRLLNNNEPGYFYLDSSETELPSDCAAFLNLSIAIKADLHLDKCISAKILQLTDTFQAKLGWLVGQQYSRVGTPDFPTHTLNAKVKQALGDAALWVDDTKVSALEEEYAQLKFVGGEDALMTSQQIESALRKVPSQKKRIIDRATKVIRDTLGPDQDSIAEKLSRRLDSDAALTALLRR